MYTTDVQDNGTVSATDEERLPPGGFSLRHGFPAWFGRASRRSGTQRTPIKGTGGAGSLGNSNAGTPESEASNTSNGPAMRSNGVSTYEVLRYTRSAFDDESILDEIPLEAAGNPGAWHAWRTHRFKAGKLVGHMGLESEQEKTSLKDTGNDAQRKISSSSSSVSKPGEWNWDGVWEERVRKNIDGSLADPVLYGAMAGDDLIRFLNMEEAEVETIMENIMRSTEATDPQRRGIV